MSVLVPTLLYQLGRRGWQVPAGILMMASDSPHRSALLPAPPTYLSILTHFHTIFIIWLVGIYSRSLADARLSKVALFRWEVTLFLKLAVDSASTMCTGSSSHSRIARGKKENSLYCCLWSTNLWNCWLCDLLSLSASLTRALLLIWTWSFIIL